MKKSTLCHLLYELFSPDRGEGATFGNYESRKKLLLAVRALLWRNSSALNSTEYDVSSNDSALLRFYINYYLSTVDEATIELNLNEKEDTDLTNRLLSPMNALRDIARSLETQDDPVSRGRGWMLLGYVQLFLFADLGPIDPVRKAALRSRYLGENVAELKRSVLIERLQSTILGDKRCSVRTNRLKEARDRSERSGDHPVRPPSRLFSDLREEVENFSRNVASFRSTFDRVERLNELAIERSENETEERLKLSRERLHEAEIWRRSLERFSAKLERNYLPGFPDLVSPIVTAVSSLRHGLSILTNPNHSARPLSHDLLRFPVAGRCQENYMNLVKLCSVDPGSRMAKIALMELENLSLAARTGGETDSLMEQLVRILDGIRMAWREQEKRREEEERERESLFRSKKKEKKEEEEIEEEFRDMFPDHGSGDFLDFREQGLDSSNPGEERGTEKEMSWRDARIVREIHSSVLRNCCFEDPGLDENVARGRLFPTSARSERRARPTLHLSREGRDVQLLQEPERGRGGALPSPVRPTLSKDRRVGERMAREPAVELDQNDNRQGARFPDRVPVVQIPDRRGTVVGQDETVGGERAPRRQFGRVHRIFRRRCAALEEARDGTTRWSWSRTSRGPTPRNGGSTCST